MPNNRHPYAKQSPSLCQTIAILMPNNRHPYAKQSSSLCQTIVILMLNNRHPRDCGDLVDMNKLPIKTLILANFHEFQLPRVPTSTSSNEVPDASDDVGGIGNDVGGIENDEVGCVNRLKHYWPLISLRPL
jgi:hypothetical protein